MNAKLTSPATVTVQLEMSPVEARILRSIFGGSSVTALQKMVKDSGDAVPVAAIADYVAVTNAITSVLDHVQVEN